VTQDLNFAIEPPPGVVLPCDESPDETLIPYDDWAAVQLPPPRTLGAAAPIPSYPSGELTGAAIDWINRNFPMPPGICPADFNHDTFVNSQDFFDFLAAFFMLQPTADFNHDTFINSQDFFDFLAALFAGC
jgi:hypothetical protein